MINREESKLISASKQGDKGAFSQLIKKHINKLYNLCYRLTGDENEAKDLSQEVFLQAFKAIKEFREEASFSTWLYRISRNIWINKYKRSQKVKFVSLDKPIKVGEDELARQIPDPKATVDQDLAKEEMEKAIQKAIATLKPEHRITIILRYMENKSYEEIAEICKCSLGTVGSRLTRAMKEMKNLLSSYF